jgi:hypothetical protein
MEQTRERALVAFERALVRLAMAPREPFVWEEVNLLEALVAITSGDYRGAIDRIAAAQRPPTATEVLSITRRKLLPRAELRRRFDDVTAAPIQAHAGSSHRSSPTNAVIGG